MQVPAEALKIETSTMGSRTRLSDDGNQLTTYFCQTYSSALFTANSARPRLRTIYVGTLDDPASIDVNAHIKSLNRTRYEEIHSVQVVVSKALHGSGRLRLLAKFFVLSSRSKHPRS